MQHERVRVRSGAGAKKKFLRLVFADVIFAKGMQLKKKFAVVFLQ